MLHGFTKGRSCRTNPIPSLLKQMIFRQGNMIYWDKSKAYDIRTQGKVSFGEGDL